VNISCRNGGERAGKVVNLTDN